MSDELVEMDPQALEVTQDERTMAMLSHLLCVFTGFIGPLVIYAIKANESKFVAYHALQATVFGGGFALVMVISYIVIMLISLVTCGFGAVLFVLLLPLSVLAVVGNVYMAIQANNGLWEGYPLLSQIGRS